MSNTTSNVRRNTAIGLTAGLLGGGAIGLMLGVPGLTSAAGSTPSAVVAQEDTPTDDTTATDDTVADDTTALTTHGRRCRRPPRTGCPAPRRAARARRQRHSDERAGRHGRHLPRREPSRARRTTAGSPAATGRGHGGFGIERGEIAELFGLEPDELRDLLQDGQSLADVATAQGVDVQTVIDTLVNAAKEHLDEAVANGRLTQEEADAKLAEITERITEMVNTARPADDD